MTDVAPAAAPEAPAPAPAAESAPKEAVEQMTPAEKKLWKLKVDGKEIDFDASDEEAIKRHVQKGLGADRRFEEGAAAKKQAEQFIHLLRTNPRAVLENPSLGLDLRKFAEDIVWEQMQEEKMTHEQKHQREIQRQLEEYKKREQEAKEAQAEAERQQLQSHYEADFERKIMTALETGGLPKTKGTVRRMAYYMSQAIQNDLDLQPEDLIHQVRKDYMDEHREMYQSAAPEVLMSLTGEDFLKKLRDADLKRLKSTQGSQFHTPDPKQTKSSSQPKPKKLSGSDWRKQLMAEAGIGKRR